MNSVVVVGGGKVGSETADFLAERGDFNFVQRREVTIVEMLPDIASDMYAATRYFLMGRLRADDVNMITSATVKEILDDGVVFTRNGVEETIRGIDNVVLALGAKSVDELSQGIKDKVAEVYVIGDAKEPRRALEAIAEGAEIARAI
jgi:NADH dehydrogenase FAD-containing subunit